MYGMPTASVARMPPSTPHRTTLPRVPSPKMAVTTLMTAGEIHAVQAAVSTRASRSPTTKSVANTTVMTPSRMGMPVRGAVVSRHQRSAAARVSCAAAASARASACRALEISSARPSSAPVRKSATSRPTARATSASPSRTASAAARGLRPPGARRPSSARAAMWRATSPTRCSTSDGSGVPAVSPRPPPALTRSTAASSSARPSPRGATVGTTGTPRSRESRSASGVRPVRRASSERLRATTTRYPRSSSCIGRKRLRARLVASATAMTTSGRQSSTARLAAS